MRDYIKQEISISQSDDRQTYSQIGNRRTETMLMFNSYFLLI